jgi:predicted anti-sigma-YlaC factor YlaD
MNCQEAIERLPWWLNGSLEPEERREVEAHLSGCASCREALAETRLASEVFAQHIPAAALVAYAADETPTGIDPGLFDLHLADCAQCAAELEMARASRLLSEHDDVPLLLPSQPRQPRQSSPARQTRPERGWRTAAMAAGLTAVIALGGLWTSVQKMERLESSANPSAVSAIYDDLSPATRGEAEAIRTYSRSAGFASLVLHPSSADTAHDHTFRISDPSGKIVVPESPLARNTDNFYNVVVNLKSLPPGAYRIQTYGTDGGQHQPLDQFPFAVQ